MGQLVITIFHTYGQSLPHRCFLKLSALVLPLLNWKSYVLCDSARNSLTAIQTSPSTAHKRNCQKKYAQDGCDEDPHLHCRMQLTDPAQHRAQIRML
jgi:hypothetical protein